MKNYIDKTVYEAARERIAVAFRDFDNVLVAFSGGKDSGVMLNLCYDYARDTGQLDKLSMYHMDYEAQYKMTTDYVTDTFNAFPGVRKYWLCLPIEAQCACRMDGATWTPWAPDQRALWVREMPQNEHVIHEGNSPIGNVRGKTDYEVQEAFSRWHSRAHGSTAVMIGIRADESLSRLGTITSQHRKYMHRGLSYTRRVDAQTVNFYPMYDWTTQDIWVCNAKNGYSYNKLYNLYYQAGLTIDQMRVASPFNDCGIHTLKLYKVIDPQNWGRMVSRVNGVNFAGIYGGTTAMGWKSITKPKGHTWKSYCYFLLSTLEPKLREHYERILATSIRYWCEKGGYVAEEIMPELEALEYTELSPDPRREHLKILQFPSYPDTIESKSFSKLPSYKRMCVCILKNDYYCKYMGFAPTKEAVEKRRATLERYKDL